MIGNENANAETVNHGSSGTNDGRNRVKRNLISQYHLVTQMVGRRIGWPGEFIQSSAGALASRNLSHPTFAKVALTCGGGFPTFRIFGSPGAQDGRFGDEELDASNRGDFWPVRRLTGEGQSETTADPLLVKVKNMEVRREGVAGKANRQIHDGIAGCDPLVLLGPERPRTTIDYCGSYPGRHDVTLRYTSLALGYEMKPLWGGSHAECGMTSDFDRFDRLTINKLTINKLNPCASVVESRNAEVQYRVLRAAVGVKLVVFVAAILSSLIGGFARSQEPAAAETKLRIARLIERLGSASYEERSDASDDLGQLGFESRKQLEEATESTDPEIRLRAKDLLLRLKVRELWSASPVKCEGEKIAAAQVLSKLSEETGNHVLVGDQYGTFHDQEVKLNYPQGEFWQVLDDLCQQSGNRVRPHYDSRSPGLVVVQGSPGKYPTAYSGPLRTQITGARRAFTEELDYDDMGSELTHTFQLNLQMMWEDRFKLVAYRAQPDLADAVTDTGVHLSATQSSGSGWNVASAGTRQLTMSLRLHPPSTKAKSLDTLKLKWGLIAVGDVTQLDVTDLESKEPHYQDDVEVVVESVVPGQNSRYEVTMIVTRELVLPEPQEVLFQENDVELFDAEGHAFRKQGQTNSLCEHGAKMKISFAGETAQSTPKVLRFTYPRIRAQKDVEILFRNVPLPVGKPE